MKRLLLLVAVLVLIAASPGETIPGLQANGYYIEDGADVSEQVVSDAVFDGRADGGRLYIVVLADEPPGGATTFADSTLDELGDGYVFVVAPGTVGYSADGTVWSREEMDAAVDASLDGGSDDEVIEIFISTLTTSAPVSPEPDQSAGGGGFSIWWILLIGGGLFAAWWLYTNRKNSKRAAGRIDQVRQVAREKLDEVANDILEMEGEIATTDNVEAREHYQRASAMYSEAMDDTARAATVVEMLKVSEELDLAIWELDCAEALLDGKPKPPKPEPPKVEAPKAPPPQTATPPIPPSPHSFDRRPQRQSTGSQEMMTMLMTMMAMGGMRGGGGFGRSGGNWTGGGGGAPRPPTSGGGGGRFRGGGRRRG